MEMSLAKRDVKREDGFCEKMASRVEGTRKTAGKTTLALGNVGKKLGLQR